MNNRYFSPVYIDQSPTVRPAVDDNWQARRELAAVLRKLNSTMLSRTVPTDTLNTLTSLLQSWETQFADNEELQGHEEHGQRICAVQGQAPDMFYEVSPAIGQTNAVAPPMHIWQDGDCIRASVNPGWGYEGPARQLHGGVIAILFDQLMGIAHRTTGNSGQTGSLCIRYLHPTPLNQELHLVARLDRVEGRKRFLRGELHAGDTCTASSEAVFIADRL